MAACRKSVFRVRNHVSQNNKRRVTLKKERKEKGREKRRFGKRGRQGNKGRIKCAAQKKAVLETTTGNYHWIVETLSNAVHLTLLYII